MDAEEDFVSFSWEWLYKKVSEDTYTWSGLRNEDIIETLKFIRVKKKKSQKKMTQNNYSQVIKGFSFLPYAFLYLLDAPIRWKLFDKYRDISFYIFQTV